MQLTLTLALDVLRGRFDEGVSDMFSAMCAWVLFANLQANLSPFRCIPHYVTQRDVERNNCSLEPVGYRHFPRPYVSTRGCGYARLDGRGAALHLTESIETKCNDLVFTFFILSKQSALFGR